MPKAFETDPYPGRPKILFIGVPYSTHIHAWIDLLASAEFNIRLFGIQDGYPPHTWKVPTYLTTLYPPTGLDPDTRRSFFPTPEEWQQLEMGGGMPAPCAPSREAWLAQIIGEWQPDIVQTFGVEPAGKFLFDVRHLFPAACSGQWVTWLWGGSDLELSRLDPEMAPRLAALLRECDQIFSDNLLNHRYLHEMGVLPEQIAPLNPIPVVGGIDVPDSADAWREPTSKRRLILWPKPYEGPWSKALPVLEALRLAWDRIQPCEIYLLSVNAETRMYYHALPERIRAHCKLYTGVPREQVLTWMQSARVMLAPSLVDGLPNTLCEAMAAGALPIVSPLETIAAVVRPEQNVLFARNLYVEEIVQALVRAMTDDRLVDQAARNNLELVRRLADRAAIGPRVIAYYADLVRNPAPRGRPAGEPVELFGSPVVPDEQSLILDQRRHLLEHRARQLETRAAALAEQEAQSAERRRILQDEAAALEQRAGQLETRAAALAEQEAQSAERRRILQDEAAALEGRAGQLQQMDTDLRARAAVLAQREVELQQLKDRLDAHEAILRQREVRYGSLFLVRAARRARRLLRINP